jgi:hypothetical protein
MYYFKNVVYRILYRSYFPLGEKQICSFIYTYSTILWQNSGLHVDQRRKLSFYCCERLVCTAQKLSVHYQQHFFSLLRLHYFSTRRDCPRLFFLLTKNENCLTFPQMARQLIRFLFASPSHWKFNSLALRFFTNFPETYIFFRNTSIANSHVF